MEKVDTMKQQKSVVKKSASKKQKAKKRELKAPPRVKTEIAMLALVNAYMTIHALQSHIEKPQEALDSVKQTQRIVTMLKADNVSDEDLAIEAEKARPLIRSRYLEAVNDAAYLTCASNFYRKFWQ